MLGPQVEPQQGPDAAAIATNTASLTCLRWSGLLYHDQLGRKAATQYLTLAGIVSDHYIYTANYPDLTPAPNPAPNPSSNPAPTSDTASSHCSQTNLLYKCPMEYSQPFGSK